MINSLNIGLDIDGTLNNIHDEILFYGSVYNKKIGGQIVNANAYYISNMFNWEKEECKKFKSYFQHELLSKAVPREDAVYCLNEIKKLGHNIYIITGRKLHEMNDTYRDTASWLNKVGIPYDKLIVNVDSKGQVCRSLNIDVLVDDREKHLYDAKNTGVKHLLLFDNVYSNQPAEFVKIKSFDELLHYIENL